MSKGLKEKLEDRLAKDIDVLRQGRDELRLQAHLGAADARDRWEQAEKSWHHLEARLKQIGQVGQESADEIEEAAKLLVSEIKSSYEHLRRIL